MPRSLRPVWFAPPTVAQQVAADIARVIDGLEGDRDRILVWWNVYRARDALLDALTTDWLGRPCGDLLALDADQAALVDAFYDELLRFRLWAMYTEAMPATLERRLDAALALLKPAADAALDALGGRPPEPARPRWPESWATLER